MPAPASSPALLAAEVGLLEVEVELARLLGLDGRTVPGHRAPSTAEVRAGVRFAELDRLVTATAADLAAVADRVRGQVLDRLAADLAGLAGDPNPAVIARRLTALADPTRDEVLDGLRDDVLGPARQDAYRLLDDLHTAAGAEAIGEADRQGAPVAGRTPAPKTPPVAQLLTDRADDVILTPYRRVLDVARQAALQVPATAGTFDVIDAAITAAEDASTKGAEDVARKAAGVAHDEGRTATLRALAASPAPAATPGAVDVPEGLTPSEVYASELLDSNTCQPCSYVDGRDYPDLEHALADYPGNGGYHACEGRDRCRGTLVIVWDTEAGPTNDNRRPEDPNAPPPLEPGPPPAPPADPATLSDDELMAGVVEAANAGDLARANTLGDELDRRDAASGLVERTPAQVEADVWAEGNRVTAAQYAADPDAYARDLARAAEEAEHAGETAITDSIRRAIGGGRARGRRIDAVRDEWAVELERRYVEMENATRGAILRKDREREFTAKYGTNAADVLMAGPARQAYYYASEEVRTYWAARPRITFSEFAVQRGVTDAKTVARARAAREARDNAALRAEEDRSLARNQSTRRRTSIPASEGDKLVRAQNRAAREREAARRAQGDTVQPDAPVAAPEPPPPVVEARPATFTPEALRSALDPARKRTAATVTAELGQTPAGRNLAQVLKSFTETRGGVANLRTNIERALDGTAGDVARGRAETFLDAMNTYPTEDVPALFRGFAVKVEENTAAWWDTFEAQFAPGQRITLNASSFTSSERKAAEFERMIGGTRKASADHTAVRYVLEENGHALPVEQLSKFRSEREWITGGDFEVVDYQPATKAQPYYRVTIRQVQTLEVPK